MKKLRLNKETLRPLGQNPEDLRDVAAGMAGGTATYMPVCPTGCVCATGQTCGFYCPGDTAL